MAEHVGNLLSAYLDQELDRKVQKRVEHHLNDCAACRQDLDEMVTLKRQIVFAYESVEVPDGFENTVMANIEGQKRISQKTTAIRNWGIAAVVAFLVIVVFSQIAPSVSLGAAVASLIFGTGFKLLHIVAFLVGAVPYLLGIVFAVAVLLIMASLWSLRRLLGAETFS